jgi:hypothetical protein
MKTSPVQGINAYENANATPEMASEANNGSPSLRQALTSTEMQAIDKTLSEYVSVDVSACMMPALHSSRTASACHTVVDCPVSSGLRVLEQLAAADAGSAGEARGLALELRLLDTAGLRLSARRSTLLLFDSCVQGYEDRLQGNSNVLILPRRALTR